MFSIQTLLFKNKCCPFKLFIRKIKKKVCLQKKILSRLTFLNIDNNKKCFLSTKSAYKDHVTLKTGVMFVENPAFSFTGINDILKYIKNRMQLF